MCAATRGGVTASPSSVDVDLDADLLTRRYVSLIRPFEVAPGLVEIGLRPEERRPRLDDPLLLRLCPCHPVAFFFWVMPS